MIIEKKLVCGVMLKPQHGQNSDAPVAEKHESEEIEERRRSDHRDDRHAPDTHYGVAKQARSEPDQISDHQRVVVIARCQMTRPQPVIGFVRFKIDVGHDPAPDRHDRKHNGDKRQ